MTKKKVGKDRLDKYYRLAKEQGFRARSAFKLIQLNKKYNFLSTARVLIDLCAAPGGWLQVASKSMPVSSIIIGVDLVPIKSIANVVTLVNDITTEECRQAIRKEIKHWKADVVLHDGAPNVGANWTQDAFSQAELVLKSMKLATEFLMEGGTFVTKVFRSKDYNSLLWVFGQLFRSVDVTKPPSSRNVSAEIFVVCKGYLAPKVIDPKFLDAKYVFEDVDAVTKANLFKNSKKKRSQGYEDGSTILFKKRAAIEFIKSEDPMDFLARHNQLLFEEDDESKKLLQMSVTKREIPQNCQDLKLLGRVEFKQLLRWRLKVRKLFEAEEKKKTEAEADYVVVTEEMKEQKLDEELESTRMAGEKASERFKKRAQKRLLKAANRMNDSNFDAADLDNVALFSMKGVDPASRATITPMDVDSSSSSEDECVAPTSDLDDDDEEFVSSGAEFDDFAPKEKEPDSEDEQKPAPIPQILSPEEITLAMKMTFEGKKSEVMEDAVNRFAFNDTDSLPKWFVEDEKKHNRPMLPVTKEAAEAYRAYLKAIDERPIKKVMEAKARKKRKIQRKLEKVNKKAEGLVESSDLTEKQKMEQIRKMYSKIKKAKEEVAYVVANKANRGRIAGRPSGVKGRYKMVDSRMKKDKRAMIGKLNRDKKTNKRKRGGRV